MNSRLVCVLLLLTSPLWARKHKSNPPAGGTNVPHPRIVLDGIQNMPLCGLHRAALEEELKTLAYPADWTIRVTCGVSYWDTARRTANYPRTSTAFSMLHARVTVLNGEIFKQSEPFYRGIIAHELGHIQCDCADEAVADKIALNLEHRTTRPSPLTAAQ